MSSNPYTTYQRTQVATADRRKIIVLLYEGAIKNLNLALKSMDKNQRDQQSHHINKTLAIINFLREALDFNQGGEIAENLANLYDYVRDILAMANIHSSPAQVKEAVKLLTTLLDGWQKILGPASAEDEEGKKAETSPNETPRISLVG